MNSKTIIDILTLLEVKSIDLNDCEIEFEKNLIMKYESYTNYEIQYVVVDTKTYKNTCLSNCISEIMYQFDKEYNMIYFKLGYIIQEPYEEDINIFAISKEDLIKNGIQVIDKEEK